MTVVAPATSLAIHQVRLAPLQVGASPSNSSSSPAPKTADLVPELKAMIHSLLIFTVLNPDT